MKNLIKVFTVMVLALGMIITVIPTQVFAAPAAQSVYSYEIIGMADQDMINENIGFEKFPYNAVETDQTIYVAIRQMGYGNRYVKINGTMGDFKEVYTRPIEQNTSYGKVIVGWDVIYKIDGLPKGCHELEFYCTGTGVPSRIVKDTAKINKI